MGESGSDDKASAALAALLQPGGNSGSNAPNGAVVKDIWESVLKGARLHGDFETTCQGACEAAHRRDWGLCAYLAAVCYCEEGQDGRSLQVPCSRWQDDAWLHVVAPILVDVPLGRERLRFKPDDADREEWVPTDRIKLSEKGEKGKIFVKSRGRGTLGRAEYFKEGSIVQPVKFKRVQLPDAAVLEVRHSLKSDNRSDGNPALLDDIDNRYPVSHIPGLWYHVLAYPFQGDLTKALLRPKVDAWTQQQRNTLQKLSETLVSRCVKAGRWDLVETLLAAGVPSPDMMREFESICSHSTVAHEAWRQELDALGRSSLLELAAWQSTSSDNKENETSPLIAVMEALCKSRQDLDLSGRASGKLPLIREAAEKGRWKLVLDLLLYAATDANVCAGSLLHSRAWASAPPKVRLLAEERSRQEKITAATKAADSLKEYFKRQLLGPVADSVPFGFTSNNGVLESGELRVLDCCLNLGPRQGKEHVFVSLEPHEMEKAKASMKDATISMLTLDLNRRECCVNDPCSDDISTCWVSLFLQASYLQQDESGAISICIPPNQLTYAHILRKYPVRVAVVSPCCEAPLKRVPVYVGGNHVGTTKDGTFPSLSFQLFPGKYTISSPGYAVAEVTIDITSGRTAPYEVQLVSTGELFIYLASLFQDDDEEFEEEENEEREKFKKPEQKDAVYLCANRDDIPAEEAACFVGAATMPDCRGLFLPRCAKREHGGPTVCFEKMHQLKVSSSDGRKFEINEGQHEWFANWNEDSPDDCLFAQLFTCQVPWCMGYLEGARPLICDPLRGANTSVIPSTHSRPPRPSTENLPAHDAMGKLRSSGMIFQPGSKPPFSTFAAPARKRMPTPDSRQAVGAAGAQRRPRSANPVINPHQVNALVALRPRSSSRGRSKTEMMYGGKALSLRSLRLTSH